MAQRITLPPEKFVNAIHGTITRVTRRCEIYEADNSTLWRSSAQLGLIGGEVGVDSTRDERRTLSMELDNSELDLKIGPGGLWYDKIIKVYRGAQASDGTRWERMLGEFLIDTVDSDDFPRTIAISARDFTKKLMGDKFATTTGFVKNQAVEEVLRTIAINGGIPSSRIKFPLTGKSTGKDFIFDRTVSRWEAMKEIATTYAFDLYFDQDGFLRLETFTDPYLDDPQYTFQTGVNSNVSEFSRRISDSRIYNHVVATGGSDDPDSIPPYAVAENNEPTSPTRIAAIGRRSYFFTSSFMTTQAQCQEVANKFLKVHALEQFEVGIEALVIPYLEAGITVQFFDPEPFVNQPTKYLLNSFSIPLTLDGMPASVRRVTAVG